MAVSLHIITCGRPRLGDRVDRENRKFIDFYKKLCYNIYRKLRKKGINKMTKELILEMKESRYARLSESQKNLKCPGVLRRLRREIRNLKKELN